MIRWALIVGCTYEVVALTTKRVPTITMLVRGMRKHPVGMAAAWLWVGYTAHHFLSAD